MFVLQCLLMGLEFIRHGIKIHIGKKSFLIIKGQRLYYVYKRYTDSIVLIENIKC